MARKDLLKGLMGPDPGKTADEAPAPSNPRYSKGAIGAVTRSIADLKARAVIEIDPALIDSGGMHDRLESDPAEDAALTRSIADYGQQVPILVRPHPSVEGRFQIVYGRRRVLALRDLGQTVKAMIRDLDDRELVMAQGQENTARRDLSFIEKCNFARQMVAAGYERRIICDALSVDKTLISRMLAVTERVPVEVIEAIGAAPGIGRDRWIAVAEGMEATGTDAGTAIAMLALTAEGAGSDARFEALQAFLMRASRPLEPPQPMVPEPLTTKTLRDPSGRALGISKRSKAGVVLRLDASTARGFDDWLVDRIADLYRQWQDGQDG